MVGTKSCPRKSLKKLTVLEKTSKYFRSFLICENPITLTKKTTETSLEQKSVLSVFNRKKHHVHFLGSEMSSLFSHNEH